MEVGQLQQERGDPDGDLPHRLLRRRGARGLLTAGADPPASGAPPRTVAVVVAAALALLLLGALPRELTKTDEHRYITVAREMAVTGDWIVCRLNGATYTHKPPGFFQAAAFAHALGASWTLAAMLPSVVGGALCVGLVFDMAHRLWGRAAALAAALALLGTKEHYLLSCRGNLDAFLSLWTTLSTWCFVRAAVLPATGRARTWWTAGAYLAAGIGVMVKGPSAIAIPGAAALATVLWDDSWGRTPWWRWALGCAALVAAPEPGTLPAPLPALLLALRIAAFVWLTGIWRSPWRALATPRWALAPLVFLPGALWAAVAAARAPEGWGYVRALAFGQGVGHAAGQVDKLQPWWFYLKSFPLDSMPWSLLLPAAFAVWVRDGARGRTSADRFAVAWLVAPLVVMSLSPAKRELYLMPVVPAVALLVGRLAAAVAADPSRFLERPVRWSVRAYAGAGVALGVLVAALGAAGLLRAQDRASAAWSVLDVGDGLLDPYVPWAAVGTGAAVAAASVALWRTAHFASAVRFTAAGAAAALGVAAWVYIPYTEARHAPRAFLEQVKARIGDAWLGDYGGADFAANWVCERSVVPPVATREDAEALLAARQPPVYLLVDPKRLTAKGMPDGARVILEDPRTGEGRLLLIGRE